MDQTIAKNFRSEFFIVAQFLGGNVTRSHWFFCMV